jgi:hypothetical protein
MQKITKSQKVKNHLLKKSVITSWDAINLYKATRLSAIIFNLRKRGWDIITEQVAGKEENGQTYFYAKYILMKNPKKI